MFQFQFILFCKSIKVEIQITSDHSTFVKMGFPTGFNHKSYINHKSQIHSPFPPNLTQPKTQNFLRVPRYKDAYTNTSDTGTMKIHTWMRTYTK